MRAGCACALAATAAAKSRGNAAQANLVMTYSYSNCSGLERENLPRLAPANFDICFISQVFSIDDGAEYDCFRGSAATAMPYVSPLQQTSCASFAWLNRHAG